MTYELRSMSFELGNISLNIFLFVNTDTIHIKMIMFQLGFRKKKSRTYMNLSPMKY